MNDMNELVYKYTNLDKVTTKKHYTNFKDSNIWKNCEEYAHWMCVNRSGLYQPLQSFPCVPLRSPRWLFAYFGAIIRLC